MRAWFKLSDANDASGRGNNGVATDVSYAAGKLGNAAQFDGANAHIVVPGSDLDLTTAMTFTWWQYQTAGSAQPQFVFSKRYGTTLQYGVYSTGSYWGFYSWVGSPGYIAASTPFAQDVWEHWAVTVSGTTVAWYKNGVAAGGGTLSGAVASQVCDFFIGARGGASFIYGFNGLLDDIRVYDEVLTLSQISAIKNDQGYLPYPWLFQPVAWYRLADANDSSGNGLHGTATDVSYVAGKIGMAAQGNGTSSSIALPNHLLLNLGGSPCTFAFWINRSGTQYYPEIIGGANASSPYSGYEVALVGTTNKLGYYAGPGSSWVSATNAFSQGVWQHAAVTVAAGGLVAFYLNGAANGTANSQVPTSWFGVRRLLSSSSGTRSWFAGLIDDVRIYNEALSPEKIQAIYRDRRGRPYPWQQKIIQPTIQSILLDN